MAPFGGRRRPRMVSWFRWMRWRRTASSSEGSSSEGSSSEGGYDDEYYTSTAWTPLLSVLLCGTRDVGSPLSIFRGYEDTVLRIIYNDVMDSYKASVILTPPAHTVPRVRDPSRDVRIAFAPCGMIEFPPPNDRSVNMLPFVLGRKESLPDDLRVYYDLAIARCPVDEEELGTVCYLTVQESYVRAHETQRRGGLHVEAPGSFRVGSSYFAAGWEHAWGVGVAYTPDEFHGGLYMASNRNGTAAVFDALIKGRDDDDHHHHHNQDDDDNDNGGGRRKGGVGGGDDDDDDGGTRTSRGRSGFGGEVANAHGGIEHLRPFLGRPTILRANELVWLTDRTPHEALAQQRDGYRQFFRLVTSKISLWYEEHSTPNPRVPLPDHVRIVSGNKFLGEQDGKRNDKMK